MEARADGNSKRATHDNNASDPHARTRARALAPRLGHTAGARTGHVAAAAPGEHDSTSYGTVAAGPALGDSQGWQGPLAVALRSPRRGKNNT